MDLLYIFLLAILLTWALSGSSNSTENRLGEFMGSFFVSLLVYGLLKWPLLWMWGGAKMPASDDPAHLPTGAISFAIVAGAWLLAAYCHRRKTNVQTLLGLRKQDT